MIDSKQCPDCTGAMTPAEAKLDQSGETFLPAVAHTCGKCQRTETRPTGEPFRPYLYDEPGLPSREAVEALHRDEAVRAAGCVLVKP